MLETFQESSTKSVAVIGAGIAGLTSAYYLKRAGFQVNVLEASGRVGGRMSSDLIDGCIIDRGAQFLSESYSTLLPLIKEVGLNTVQFSSDAARERLTGTPLVRI